MKRAPSPRFDRSHRRSSPGTGGDDQRADPDFTRFGATAGPAGLATWAVLFEHDSGQGPPPAEPAGQRHRWRRKP